MIIAAAAADRTYVMLDFNNFINHKKVVTVQKSPRLFSVSAGARARRSYSEGLT